MLRAILERARIISMPPLSVPGTISRTLVGLPENHSSGLAEALKERLPGQVVVESTQQDGFFVMQWSQGYLGPDDVKTDEQEQSIRDAL